MSKLSKIENIIFALISLGLIICAVAFGIYFRFNVPDAGMADIKTVDDALGSSAVLYYAADYGSAPYTYDDPEEFENTNIIAIVEPTGNINQTNQSLGLEVTVKELIKAEDKISEGTTVWIYQYDGFTVYEDVLYYTTDINLMYPGNEYLIFLYASPLNEYQNIDVFLMSNETYGYIRIGEQDTKAVGEDYENLLFGDMKEYDFFCVSDSDAEEMNRSREEILDKYLPDDYQ